MPRGNECPACGENIGVLAVFRAPLPNRIYCPHCQERLRYGHTDWLVAAAVLLLSALLVGTTAAALLVGFSDPVVVAAVVLGALILGGAGLELAFVLMLWYGNYRLESVNRPPSEWDDSDEEWNQ
jgi:hypothetical protein